MPLSSPRPIVQSPPWAELLARELATWNIQPSHLARSIGTPAERITDWLTGRTVPAGRDLARLHGCLPRLRAYRDLLAASRPAQADPLAPPTLPPCLPSSTPPGKTPPVPDTKQEPCAPLLRKLRVEAGMSQREVGKLVGVDNSLIGFWERGAMPIPDERRKALIDLFPPLADADYTWRGKPKRASTGGPSAPSPPKARRAVRRASPAPSKTPARPPRRITSPASPAHTTRTFLLALAAVRRARNLEDVQTCLRLAQEQGLSLQDVLELLASF